MVMAPPTTGTFNPNLAPGVTICRLDATQACVANTSFSPGPAQLDPTGQQYKVNWNTDPATISLSAIYRIIVSAGGRDLGFADVQPASNGSQLKNIETGEFIGLVDGRTLPIKFRIEQGAICFGQTDCVEQTVFPLAVRQDVVTPGKLAAASFPPGYFGQNTTVTIAQVPVGCFDLSTTPRPSQDFGCYSFTTDPKVDNPLNCTANPANLTTPDDAARCARVEVCPTLLPSDESYHGLHLFKSDPGQPAQLLQEASATLITNCAPWVPPPTIGSARGGRHGLVDLARAGLRRAMHAIGRLVRPQPLFGATAMAHLGLGGMTCCYSNIGFSQTAILPPTLLLPLNGALIPQNNPNIGCTLSSEPTRGFGFQIVFDWTDATSPAGIAGYELFAKQNGADLPIVNTFVEDANLAGWEWRVRAKDNAGIFSDFVTGTFGFEPCRLPDESACRAPSP